MEKRNKVGPSPQAIVYSSTIVSPMATEASLSSTISAAINSSNFSPADTIPSESTTVITAAPQAPQQILLPNTPPVKNAVGHAAILPIAANPSLSSQRGSQDLQRGVIYALNQYSPFLSLSRPPTNVHPSLSGVDNEHHSKLGPEDVAEVRQMTSAVAATSFHEHSRRSEAGKCQSGGELRLTELSHKLNNLHVPEGFVLVGAKSPMLTGMMLVAAVDKRYLPGEKDTLTTPGFSGNCVGCGATGFRYFTEFSTHINLKLATQPKKQKHLKCYITQAVDGKWGKGHLIPWKGTETKKRSHITNPMPIIQQNQPGFQNYHERFSEYHKFPSRPSLIPVEEPPAKKQKAEEETELSNDIPPPPLINNQKTSLFTPYKEHSPITTEEATTPEPKNQVKFSDDTNEDTLESLNRSMSAICGVRPVLLLCHEISKKLPNSVDDLVVSDLLVGCFDFPDTLIPSVLEETSIDYPLDPAADKLREQTAANTLINMGSGTQPPVNKNHFDGKSWPSVSARLKEAATTTLPLNAAIILFTQYLINLDESGINKENIELVLNKARIEMSTSTINSLFIQSQSVASTHAQLSLMINLQCSASNGKVRVMTSTISFQNALYKALQWLNETFYVSKVANKKMKTPDFVIILSTPPEGPVEFAVLVTGVSHAKILAESLRIDSVVCKDFTESLKKLRAQFSQTDTALNRLIKVHERNQGEKVFYPFNEFPGKKLSIEEAEVMHPKQAPLSAKPYHTKGVFANQAAMAHQLLKQLRNVAENPDILDLASFLHVDICIVVPPVASLYYMTVKRLCESGVLNFLGLEQLDVTGNHKLGEKYVITYDDWPASIEKWTKFVNNIQSRNDTLHLLIFDQAQRFSLPQGMPDILPNLKEVFESVNVIPVFVTSVPYMFQTNKSFIDPDNEIYWTDTQQGSAFSKYTDDERVMINDQDMLYFGVKELCDSTRWNQQFSLIRTEETLDWALPKANRLNDINYSIVQGYVLLRLYQASLMVGAGVKPAEPYAVMSFITMVNDIIEAPLHNTDGSGSMLMIRIPNRQLSKHFHDVLLKTRNSLGLQYRFDVIHDDGDSELEIGEHFLARMRRWKIMRGWKEEHVKNWKPKCLEELLDLPCFLILSGEDRSGETLPRSLKYADFNILNQSKFHRSTIEAEIGMCSCYLMINGGTHSALSNRPAVMNNLRTSCGTTYLNPQKQGTECDINHSLEPNSDGSDNCEACLSKDVAKQHMDTCTHFSSKYPLPIVLISKPLWLMLNSDQGDTRGLVHLNSDPNTRWFRSSRPLLMTSKPDRISRYYRRWTEPRPARKMVTTPAAPSTMPSPGGSFIDDDCDTQSHNEVDQILASPPKRQPIERRDSEQIDHEDKDNEDSDKAQYHPRCFLFSGPPQAGKTGSYLYFAYLLHRMLMRLKRVDVYDNCVTYTPSTFDDKETCADVDVIANWQFLSKFLDMRREKFSRIHVCCKSNEVHNPIVSSRREEGTNKALVILAKTALYDTLHHCDVCKFYREGIASAVSRTYDYNLTSPGLQESVALKIVVPPIHSKYFDVDEETNTVQRLILPTTDLAQQTVTPEISVHMVKSPILMMSTVGEEEGLLNLFHGMEETDHIHVTFIQYSEVAAYQKQWPNHIFVGLPDSFSKASDSAVKNIMKTFASQNYNSNEEKRSADGKGGTTWPFVLFVPDNVVMWQKYWKEECYSSDSDEETTEKKERHSNGSVRDSITRDTASLLEFLTSVESNEKLLQHAVIGIRPWSSFQDEAGIPICVRTFFEDCFLLDVNKTQQIQYSPHVYSGENLDFHLKVLDEKLPTCRFEHFTFMLKVTSNSKWRTRNGSVLGIEPLSSQDVTRFVCQPDVDTLTPLEANPHHVFQKYLKYTGSTIFPFSVQKPDNPVLVIGGYLNLGPQIDVCVLNNGDFQDKIMNTCCYSSTEFSGLIIYNCSRKLSKDCFSAIKFVKKSKLIFVCEERAELRNEAIRLDLEEDWRFRLRDEYQTATKPVEGLKALHFLTGTKIF